MSFSKKSTENYTLALSAFSDSKYNAAASRLYYALYQACVKIHTDYQRKATDFMSRDEADLRKDALGSSTDAQKWPHDVIVRDTSLCEAGLSRSEIHTFKQSKSLRIIGDYGDKDHVRREDLEPLIKRAPNVLKLLGVTV